jgi:hypothetical protein
MSTETTDVLDDLKGVNQANIGDRRHMFEIIAKAIAEIETLRGTKPDKPKS